LEELWKGEGFKVATLKVLRDLGECDNHFYPIILRVNLLTLLESSFLKAPAGGLSSNAPEVHCWESLDTGTHL